MSAVSVGIKIVYAKFKFEKNNDKKEVEINKVMVETSESKFRSHQVEERPVEGKRKKITLIKI